METINNPENQNLNQNTFQSLPQKNNYKILFLIFLGLFLIVSTILVTLLFTQKESEISKTIETKEQKINPTDTPISEVTNTLVSPTIKLTTTPVTSSSIPKDWKTYENKKIGFSVQYPSVLSPSEGKFSDGTFASVSFNKSQEKPGGDPSVWGIDYRIENQKTIEQIKKEIGNQFSDKKQKEETVTINDNIKATKIITTTASIPDWYSVTIIIKDTDNNLYIISNGARTDEKVNELLKSKDVKFQDFYSSFKFI